MDGYVTIGTELDTKSFDAQIDYVKSQLEEIEYKLKQADMGFEVGDVQKLEAEYEKLTTKLGNLVRKKEEFNKTDFSGIKNSIDKIGNSVERVTKKVGHWALAVFGIRSAYSAVRSAIGTLSQYDDQMAINIEWIRYLLASTLKPVIEGIIQLVYKLLAYINAIAKAWFHVDLFANASTEAFEKNNRSLKGSVKQAKELNKQLAGFDEMNVLQENGDVSSGGGGGGATLPDFGAMEDIKIPGWLQWIIDHKDEVIAVFSGLVTFLKLAGKYIKKLGLGKGLKKAIGIGIAVGGIVYAIEGLIKYLKDPSWENFGQIIQGIGVAIIGLGIAFLGLPAVIVGVAVLIVGTVIKYWEQIKSTLQKGINWLKDKSDWVHKHLGDVIGNIYDFFVNIFQRVLDYFDEVFTAIKKVFDGVIEFLKGVFTGDWKKAFEGLKKIFSGIFDAIYAKFKLIFGYIYEYAKMIINNIIAIFNKLKDVVSSIFNTIKNIISSVFDFIKNNIVSPVVGFFTGVFEKIKSSAETVFNGMKDVIKGIFDSLVDIVKVPINLIIDAINLVISGLNKISIKVPKWVPIYGGKRWGISIGKVPKLASGGIINQPGRGVAIGGEAGPEAVVPLTNAQQMELLGEAIGRYIRVELTNVTQLDGRQIARKVEQINNNNRFVLNR